MPSIDYHESLWEGVPPVLSPPALQTRLDFLAGHITASQRVLDVGCGDGQLTAQMVAMGAHVTGIDVAREPLHRANQRARGAEFMLVEDGGRWPLLDAIFDVVWAGEVIEHVADTAGWLSEVRRVLRPGGTLLITTPAHTRLRRLELALFNGAFDRHFDPRSDHLRFYTRRTLAELLADFRFDHIQITGAGGLPLTRRLMLASARRARF